MSEQLERVASALKKENINAYCVECADDVIPLILEIVEEGSLIGMGGSMTLAECRVTQMLRESEDYDFLDRDAPGMSQEDIAELSRDVFSADWFFSSANAITEKGEIVNLDGIGNRVAAITFGPTHVLLVVGVNKIVPDMPAAIERVRNVASPQNAKRLDRKTPCTLTGRCSDCHSKECICAMWQVIRHQRDADRMHVILVDEELGY